MLHHRDAFSLRRLLTTPSSSAVVSSPPRTDPSLFLKYLFGVLCLVVPAVIAEEGYCVYLACRGDVPTMYHGEGLWIPSTNMDTKALLEEVPEGSFYIVVGGPGIGKTTRLCDAARDRGAAIYLDGAAQQSFKSIQATINQRYRSLRLSFMSWMRPQSGLEILGDLSFWVKLFRRKHLVFIVDHIEKLDQADVLQLVSWAKTQADGKHVQVILVGSEQSNRPSSNNDVLTRGRFMMWYPPTAQETREALRKFMSTQPDKYNLDVEKCLYLRGTRPTHYQPSQLLATEERIMDELRDKHAGFEQQGRDFRDVDFWFTLLVAGSNGVSLVEDARLLRKGALQETRYYVPDRNKVLSEPCILYYKGKVYFISGCSRELHAPLVLRAYKGEVWSSSAEVERLSAAVERLSAEVERLYAEVERLSAEVVTLWPLKREREKRNLVKEEQKLVEQKEKLVKEREKLVNEKEKLVKAEEKLVTAKERIAKIQECMSNKSYEAYGPL